MVVRKDIDDTSAILTVAVPRETFKPKLDAELKRIRQKSSIKGFRQGQAPMSFVKKLYGSNILGETLNEMLSQELYDYLKESGLQVLGQPLPTEEQAKFNFSVDDPDPEYAVNYEVGFVPSFEVQGLNESTVFDRLVVSNLDELAEDDLQYARKRMGTRSSPEEDIQENDLIKVAAREIEGDAPKAGGWETTLTILVKDVIDDVLKAKLLGMKKGDTVRLNPRHIEKRDDEAAYRKFILSLDKDDDRPISDTFEGMIEDVSRVGEADLDEDFYKGYFGEGITSKEEAIEQIKKGIQQFYDVRSNALLMRSFQERLMAENPIPLPDTFLKRWLFVNNEGRLPREQIEREYPAFADNLRWSLMRDQIKEQFGLEVTDADVYESYAQRVRNYFQGQIDLPEELMRSSVERLMQEDKDVEDTKRDLETDKIFTAIRSVISVQDKPVTSEELHKILDETTKKAEAEQQEDAALREAVEEE